jgi:hypothetical protein
MAWRRDDHRVRRVIPDLVPGTKCRAMPAPAGSWTKYRLHLAEKPGNLPFDRVHGH